MSNVGQIEKKTQARVVKLFCESLGYEYLGNWIDRTTNRNIESDLLRGFLRKQGYEENLTSRALHLFDKTAGDTSKSLFDRNKAVYELLRYGVKVKPEVGENTETVWLIDWKQPLNNRFGIAEEVTVKAADAKAFDKRPDVVLYVNGIALGVLELKRSTVSVTEGIRQNLDNQKPIFIEPFFSTLQLLMAGNDTEGLRYGSIETKEKYYLAWKEDSPIANLLDRQLSQLCNKERFLELIHNFIVYDSGIKKLCRQNQYFGVRAAQEFIKRREGGIIWHTQGSGKSLTMVWLTKWIRENRPDARVLIITDRTELDEQIEKVFTGVNEQIYRTTSGADLIAKLNAPSPWLLCSLIHKFSGKEGDEEVGNVSAYLDEVKKSLPPDFVAKGDLTVFVDECHRTQSGELHKAMKALLPNAVFIGFTGTPLLKADKQRSFEVFGQYIHTYKFNEAVKDGVVLDLRYEARDIDQNITSQAKIDQWFEAKTQGLNDLAKAQLKQKWGTMQRVLSSQSRLEKIVADILLDMEVRDRLQSGRGNAMLVTSSIFDACKCYELFSKTDLADKCAIVTSYRPSPADIKGEASGEGLTEKLRKYEIYNKMLNGQEPEAFEKAVKKKFINEPGQMKLLIVVDKLLTGFDAPPATYLYIDKKMRDHGLFQAICRINRLDGDDKEYGYIIDYQDLFESLHYFCGPDTSDKECLKEREAKRLALYKHTSAFIRAYANIANELEQAGFKPMDIVKLKADVDHYEKVRTEVKLASGDYIDLKMYEPAMRHLIDTYIRAEESEKISAFDELTLVEMIVERGVEAVESLPKDIRNNQEAVAETIENNVRKLIIDETPINPKYYEKMSELLDALIAQRKKGALDYQAYLAEIVQLAKKVQQPSTGPYPSKIDTAAKRALYDNLDKDEDLATAVHDSVHAKCKDGWRGHKVKEKEVKNAVRSVLHDDALSDKIFDVVKNQREY